MGPLLFFNYYKFSFSFRLKVRLVQHVEYFIERGVLGLSKEIQHLVLEYRGEPVPPDTRTHWDSAQSLILPVMPPSIVGVCRLMHIYYVLKVNITSSFFIFI